MSESGDRTRAYYEGAAGADYHQAVHGREIESESAFRAKATLARHRYFRDLPASSKVFEFGVGTGVNLALLEAERKTGLDISETARQLSNERGIDTYSNMEDVPRHYFDVVICRHVLEHVPDPTATLEYLATRLQPDGRLLLVLPVEGRRARVRRIPHDDVNQHLFHWKLDHITNLLRVCGFEVEAFSYEWYSMQRLLAWMPDVLGVAAYSWAVALAGRLRRQSEMVVWARLDQTRARERAD